MSEPAVITAYDDLPAEVQEAYGFIPMVGPDLVHPFKPDSGVWMAHCTNPGCGVYVDDAEVLPATDFLCDGCEEAGVSEE